MIIGVIIILLTSLAVYLQWRLSGQGVRDSIVSSWLVLTLFVFAATEILSLFHCFKPLPILWIWAVFLIIQGILLFSRRHAVMALGAKDLLSFYTNSKYLCREHRFSFLAVAAILLLTFVHAVFAPSCEFDSLSYHLPRATHWLSNGSVEFYETAIFRQNYQAPLYSFVAAHLLALTHTDIFLNLIQWVSLIVSAMTMSLIVKEVGGNRRSQWLVLALTFAIPQVLSQVVVCVNDLFAATAVMIFVLFLIRFLNRERIDLKLLLALAAAIGISFATKYTSLVHIAGLAVPLTLIAIIKICRDVSFKYAIKVGLALIFAVVLGSALLLPHVCRNLSRYGNPLSGSPPHMLTNVNLTPKKLVVNYLRHLSIHAALPVAVLNKPIEDAVRWVSGPLVDDPDITYSNRWYPTKYKIVPPLGKISSFASNPVQLFFFSWVCLAILLRIKSNLMLIRYFVLPVFAGSLLYCCLFKWQPWSARLQIPYFMLMTVAVVLWVERESKAVWMQKGLVFISLSYAAIHILLFPDWYLPAFLYGNLSAESGLNERASLAQKIRYLVKEGFPDSEIENMRNSVPEVLSKGYSLFFLDRDRMYLGNSLHDERSGLYEDLRGLMGFVLERSEKVDIADTAGLLISSDQCNLPSEREGSETPPFSREFVMWHLAKNITAEKRFKLKHFADSDPESLVNQYFGDQAGLILSDYSRESVLDKLQGSYFVDRVFSNTTFSVYQVYQR